MKIFLYETINDLSLFFQTPSHKIPFLSADLFTFFNQAAERYTAEYGDEVTIYTPSDWHEDNPYDGAYTDLVSKDRYELVLVCTPLSAPVGDLLPDEVTFLKQNPDKMFFFNGVLGGYIKGGEALSGTPEEDASLFSGFWQLTLDNFLELNQELVSQLQARSAPDLEDSHTFGTPVVLSPEVYGSTIGSPVFIGKDVKVYNSYIGAGTVLTGNTEVRNSRIYSSFIHDSIVRESPRVESVLIASDSLVEGQTIDSPSRLPYGTTIFSKKGHTY